MTAPARATLSRYGLSFEDWRAMYERQLGACAICRKKSDRLCVDHDHVPGWKDMAAADRRRYVRGLLCWWCNTHVVGRGVTLERLRSALRYLETPAPWMPR